MESTPPTSRGRREGPRRGRARWLVVPLLAELLIGAVTPPAVPAQAERVAMAGPRATQSAIVNVSVATLWLKPNALRSIDAPSASNPVNIRFWTARMTPANQQWLLGRLQTQVLYATTVTILEQRGSWTRIAVPDQPSQLDPRGYPGWIPSRQLTRNLSLLQVQRSHPVAIVTDRTAWLRNPTTRAPVLEVSFSTRLWIVGSRGKSYLIATPNGGKLAIARSAVATYASVRAIPRPTGAQIVATARRFLGLPYLWGGTTALGFDCSGFVYTIYRRFGIAMPRDADQQALRGSPIGRASLRPGDLLFFAGAGGAGTVHHVAIYVGNGTMIHAPDIGDVVRIAPLSSLGSEYAGARRYL